MFEDRGALTTPYARSQGAWFIDQKCEDDNKGYWWLRYYGKSYEEEEGEYDFISRVNFDGYIEMAKTGRRRYKLLYSSCILAKNRLRLIAFRLLGR